MATEHTMELAQLHEEITTKREWLSECPFGDGQPFWETAAREMAPLLDRFEAALHAARQSEAGRMFAWEEIDGSLRLVTQTPTQQKEADEEGGWELHEVYANGVREFATDRHYSLEVEAFSEIEAREKFAVSEKYREFYED